MDLQDWRRTKQNASSPENGKLPLVLSEGTTYYAKVQVMPSDELRLLRGLRGVRAPEVLAPARPPSPWRRAAGPRSRSVCWSDCRARVRPGPSAFPGCPATAPTSLAMRT